MKGKAGTGYDVTNIWKVDPRILKKLEGSFFHTLANMTSCKQCHIFQDFICRCYNQAENIFTFGSNNDIHLYLGLQDMYAISGIPVDGKPIICDDKSPEKLCRDLLGSINSDIAHSKRLQVNKQWLRSNFQEVPENLNESQLNYYVRAYLLYLIGTKIIPSCDGSSYYPVFWLQFLEDLNPRTLDSFAWGAASHCLLSSSYTRSNKGLLGPMWVLEMFFLERIPKIKDAVLGSDVFDESEKDIPLVNYYSPLLEIPGQRTNNKGHLSQLLDDIRCKMTYEDIVWRPYEKYKSYQPQRIFFSRTVLINYNRLHYHEPQRAPQQLNISNLGEVAVQERLVMKSSKGQTDRTYLQKYAQYIRMWKERHLHTVCIKDTSSAFTLPLCPDESDEEDDEEDDEASDEASNPHENRRSPDCTSDSALPVSPQSNFAPYNDGATVSPQADINDGDFLNSDLAVLNSSQANFASSNDDAAVSLQDDINDETAPEVHAEPSLPDPPPKKITSKRMDSALAEGLKFSQGINGRHDRPINVATCLRGQRAANGKGKAKNAKTIDTRVHRIEVERNKFSPSGMKQPKA